MMQAANYERKLPTTVYAVLGTFNFVMHTVNIQIFISFLVNVPSQYHCKTSANLLIS